MTSEVSTDLLGYIKDNSQIVANYIETLSQYGTQPDGGIIRPVYSPQWLAAHNQVVAWLQEVGLEIRRDAVGNLFGRHEGSSGGSVIMSGSHLDTVKRGGKYDGALGIIAALSAARFLKELYGQPRRPVEVVALCEEEGSRFSNSFLGSRAITGNLPASEMTTARDAEGITVAEAAQACGFDPSQIEAANRFDLGVYLELHIEQGRLLDDAQVQTGIVQAITGVQHLKVRFSGQADHAGTTPMNLRSDALVAAADAISQINRFARELGHPAVATVGVIGVEPGARNIVPELAEIAIDFRHSNPAIKAQMAERIRQICREAGQAQNVQVAIEQLADRTPAQMSPEIIAALTESAQQLNLSFMPMISGAGHDAMVMVERVPSSMVFVPSIRGRSHSAAEYTPIEQIVPGIAVLAQTIYNLAYKG